MIVQPVLYKAGDAGKGRVLCNGKLFTPVSATEIVTDIPVSEMQGSYIECEVVYAGNETMSTTVPPEQRIAVQPMGRGGDGCVRYAYNLARTDNFGGASLLIIANGTNPPSPNDKIRSFSRSIISYSGNYLSVSISLFVEHKFCIANNDYYAVYITCYD